MLNPIRPTGLAAFLALALTSVPLMAQTTGEGAAEPAATETDAGAEAEAAPQVLTEYDASTVVLTVNGADITLGELIAVRQTLPEEYQRLPGEVLMDALSDQFATQTLLAEAARAAGVGNRNDVMMRLKTQEQALLAETYLRQEILKRVTEDRVRETYDQQYSGAEPQEEVRAGHILVETEEEAKSIKAEIDGGATFAEMAAKHGTDGTAQNGGDLGWFVKTDMVPEFAEAAFAMEAGTISDPVQSPFGWHLIKLDERRPRAAPPLEQVYPEIQGQLIQQAEREVIEGILADRDVTRPEIGVPGDAIKEDALLAPAE
ncbi:MAG: peptidylprolyl isomerase [Pseudomonadota bacterium]